MLVGYASGQSEIKEAVTETLAALNAPPAVLFSTLGRTAARAIETRLAARWGLGFFQQLIANIKAGDTRTFTKERWEPATWPAEARGVGAARHRAARSRTGWSSRMARSRTIKWWFRAPGTPRRATARASAPPMRRHSSARR